MVLNSESLEVIVYFPDTEILSAMQWLLTNIYWMHEEVDSWETKIPYSIKKIKIRFCSIVMLKRCSLFEY